MIVKQLGVCFGGVYLQYNCNNFRTCRTCIFKKKDLNQYVSRPAVIYHISYHLNKQHISYTLHYLLGFQNDSDL